MTGRRLIGYPPLDHILAALPSPTAAEAAAADLRTAGFDADAVTVLAGEESAARFDGRGRRHGLAGRLYRLVQLAQIDAAPDFGRYEEALRAGGAVVAVGEPDPARRRAVRSILRGRGASFVNFYGRFFTEMLDP